MPDEPSEDDFRMALRSGIILCTALNKIQPGAVPKVYIYICICICFVLFHEILFCSLSIIIYECPCC